MAGSRQRFFLLPRARADLDAVWTYTAEAWSPAQADRYIAEINSAFEALAGGERTGRKAEVAGGYFRHSVGSHVVFYRVAEGGLIVVRVLHRRMDFERHL